MNLIRKSFEKYTSKIELDEVKAKLYPRYRLMWIVLSCFLASIFVFLAFVEIYTGFYGDEAQGTKVFAIALVVMLVLCGIFALMTIIITVLLSHEMKKALQYEKLLKNTLNAAAFSNDVCAARRGSSLSSPFGEREEERGIGDEDARELARLEVLGDDEDDRALYAAEWKLLFPDPDIFRQLKTNKKKQYILMACIEFFLTALLFVLAFYFRDAIAVGEGIGFVFFAVILAEELLSVAFYFSERMCFSVFLKRQRARTEVDERFALSRKAQERFAALRPYYIIRFVCFVLAIALSLTLALLYPSSCWSVFGIVFVITGMAIMRVGKKRYRKQLDALALAEKDEMRQRRA